MNISYNGYNTHVLTMEANENITVGKPVCQDSDGDLIPAPNDKSPIGVCVYKRGELAGIQTDGYVELPYSGNAPGYGYAKLYGNGTGGVLVTTAAAATAFKVLKVDTTNGIVGFIL